MDVIQSEQQPPQNFRDSHETGPRQAMKKLILISLWFLSADVCRADYELRLSDGVKLTWDEYTVEGGQYCTLFEQSCFKMIF